MLKDEVESLEKELSQKEAEFNILKRSKEPTPSVDANNSTAFLEKQLKELKTDNEMMSIKEKQMQLYNKQLESVVVSSRETVIELKQKVTNLEVAQKTWEEQEKNFKNEIQASAAKIQDLQKRLSETDVKTVQSSQELQQKEVSVPESASANILMDVSKMNELTEQLKDKYCYKWPETLPKNKLTNEYTDTDFNT